VTKLRAKISTTVAPLADAEETHQKHAHEFQRHHAAPIVGNTSNDGSKNGLSVGIDHAYRFNRWLGLGGIAKYGGGDFKHLLLLAGASIHPYKNWVLVVMGGTEFTKNTMNMKKTKERENGLSVPP
jgi:hypothetical protein